MMGFSAKSVIFLSRNAKVQAISKKINNNIKQKSSEKKKRQKCCCIVFNQNYCKIIRLQ